MVTMSNVWDRAMDVVRERTAPLAAVALATLFLPGLLRDAVPLAAAPGSTGFALAGGLLAVAAGVAAIWGQLALLAIATDPATTRADAAARATARFPAALAVTVVAILVLLALLLPPVIAVALSGVDLSAMATAGSMPSIGGGTVAFLLLYGTVVLVGGLIVAGRFLLVNPVVLNERRGLGAFRRSWTLSQGLTWRIAGVILLYGVVLVVAVSAAQFITGALFGLLLDGSRVAVFLAAGAAGLVTTALSVVATAFTAQLDVAVNPRAGAGIFE